MPLKYITTPALSNTPNQAQNHTQQLLYNPINYTQVEPKQTLLDIYPNPSNWGINFIY